MKSYTDLEQSKKLMEFLSLESADMCYLSEESLVPKVVYNGMAFFNSEEERLINIIYCWSVAALMNVLDRGALFITPQGWACQSYINFKAITSDHHSNPIDACYEIILRLHELKML